MLSSQARPLYLMVKPPRSLAESIAGGIRCTQTAAQLHMTLLPLGDRRHYSDPAFGALANSIAQLQLFAFRVVFDRIHESPDTVELKPTEAIQDAATFHRALRAALGRQGVDLPIGYAFNPHMTLAYQRDGLGDGAILPISWLVEDLCLVESVHGERRHIEHARFPLLSMAMAA